MTTDIPAAVTISRAMRRGFAMAAFGAAAWLSGCVSLAQSLVFPKKRWQYDMPAQAAGQLSWEETVRLCEATKSIRVEPTLLYVRVGEQIGISDFTRALAIDSAGRVLGEPRIMDWDVTGRAVQILREGDELLARRNGEAELVLSYPAGACANKILARAAANVLIVVGDTGSTTSRIVRAK